MCCSVWSPETVESDRPDRGQGAHIAGYALPDFGETLGERAQNAGSRTPRRGLASRRVRCSVWSPETVESDRPDRGQGARIARFALAAECSRSALWGQFRWRDPDGQCVSISCAN